MRLDSVLLAEGMARDARGALTLVGLHQNVQIAAELPTTARRFLVGHVEVDYPPGTSLEFRLTITSPNGEVTHEQVGKVQLRERRFPELPGALDIPVELIMEVQSHGTFTFGLAVEGPDGDRDEGAATLYVLDPSQERRPAPSGGSGEVKRE